MLHLHNQAVLRRLRGQQIDGKKTDLPTVALFTKNLRTMIKKIHNHVSFRLKEIFIFFPKISFTILLKVELK